VVGLGGLEPPTSSLSGMAAAQVSRYRHPLTSVFIPQRPPGHPSRMHPLDAWVTHADSAALGDVGTPTGHHLGQAFVN
jgi:hypothetical protein